MINVARFSTGPGIPFVKEVVNFDFALREGDWVHYQVETLVNQDGVRIGRL